MFSDEHEKKMVSGWFDCVEIISWNHRFVDALTYGTICTLYVHQTLSSQFPVALHIDAYFYTEFFMFNSERSLCFSSLFVANRLLIKISQSAPKAHKVRFFTFLWSPFGRWIYSILLASERPVIRRFHKCMKFRGRDLWRLELCVHQTG